MMVNPSTGGSAGVVTAPSPYSDIAKLEAWVQTLPNQGTWLDAHPEIRERLKNIALRHMSGLAAGIVSAPDPDLQRLMDWAAAHPDKAALLAEHPVFRRALKNFTLRHMRRGIRGMGDGAFFGPTPPPGSVFGDPGGTIVPCPDGYYTDAGGNCVSILQGWASSASGYTTPIGGGSPVGPPIGGGSPVMTSSGPTTPWVGLALVGLGAFALIAMMKK